MVVQQAERVWPAGSAHLAAAIERTAQQHIPRRQPPNVDDEKILPPTRARPSIAEELQRELSTAAERFPAPIESGAGSGPMHVRDEALQARWTASESPL